MMRGAWEGLDLPAQVGTMPGMHPKSVSVLAHLDYDGPAYAPPLAAEATVRALRERPVAQFVEGEHVPGSNSV